LVGNGLPSFATYGAASIGIGVMAANGAIIWAGTTEGLYQSTDSGASWTRVAVNAGFSNARVTDITVDGANVYVVLSEATTGYSYAGIYKSTTSGTAGSFTSIMGGLPTATLWNRSQVAIARSTPQTLYLAIAGTVSGFSDNLLGIYKTIDGGTQWNLTTTQPLNYMRGALNYSGSGQGFYDNMIAVDPSDANLVYAGGVHVVGSTDGGGTWVVIVNVYCGFTPPCNAPIHPDNHAAAFGPTGAPHPLYIANDGGVWRTANGNQGAAATWTDLNTNLATTQFYGGDVAADYTVNPIVIAGSQDNGTSRTASTAIGTWNGIHGGDGGFVSIDKTNPNIVVASYPRTMYRTTNANAGAMINWTGIQPAGNCQSGALFVSPFMIDPLASNHIVFGGGGYLCESINSGANWFYSNFNLFFGQSVQSVMIAPANSAVMYAGTTGGRIYRTTNGNIGGTATWSDLWTGKGLPTQPVTWIAVDRNDATGNIAYATFGGFGVGHVWKTINGGTSWTNITGNMPDAPVTGLVTYPISGGSALVVGTDVGTFLSTNGGASWTALQNGLPNVGIDQIFTDKALTTLFVATHGRGVLKMPIPADGLVAPTVTAASPAVGSPDGGTNVTVTGTNFRPGASVYFDGVAATNSIVVNTTTMTATTPAHQPGKINVTVVDTDNQGGTLVQGFIYGVLNALPQPRPGGVVTGSPVAPPLSRGGTDLHQPTNPSPSPRL
nr:IPT/TIG domain-containing protein [Chloroflexota bacterium]